MAEPYVGEIKMSGFYFAMRNWAKCDGQVMIVNENPTLFALLGVAFGGDGRVSYNLPDLRGRVPVHVDPSNYRCDSRGMRGGLEMVSLIAHNMPSHSHRFKCSDQLATENAMQDDDTNVLAVATGNDLERYGSPTNLVEMGDSALSATGGGEPHWNLQPSLVINFEISLSGAFPSRN